MQSGTVSRIGAFLEINCKQRISCQFKRHLSPMTVGLISRSFPIQGNAHKIGHSILYFETKINSGIERKKTDFNKGDIAFLVQIFKYGYPYCIYCTLSRFAFLNLKMDLTCYMHLM